ncbi:hypothetical protein HYZ70_03080 [Candidatus Curtissbacteria bacterium]|nr:hypothetical protein [Candidatus Curtissbacteria bacterium]
MAKKLLLLTLIFLLSFKVITDSDLGWHIRVGEHIASTKSIPKTDLFSFSHPDYPYVYHSWGSEVLMYIAFMISGLPGVTALFAAAQTLALLLLLQAAKITSGKINYIFAGASALLVYPIAGGRVRIFAFLMFCALYLLFEKFQKQNSKLIWLVPILFILWANLHGSFIVGLGFLAALTASTILFGGKSKILGLILFLSAGATLINPYGTGAATQALSLSLKSTATLRNINYDWASLISPDTTGWIFATLAAGLLIASIFKKATIDRPHKLLLLLFFALSLVTSRFALPLLVLVIPVANHLIQKLARELPKNHHLLPIKTSILALILILPLMATINILEVKSAYQSPQTYAAYLEQKAPDKIRDIGWSYPAGQFVFKNLQNKRVLNDANW